MMSGPLSYRDFRETGPQSENEDTKTRTEDRRPWPCGLKRRPSGLKRRPTGLKRRPRGLKSFFFFKLSSERATNVTVTLFQSVQCVSNCVTQLNSNRKNIYVLETILVYFVTIIQFFKCHMRKQLRWGDFITSYKGANVDCAWLAHLFTAGNKNLVFPGKLHYHSHMQPWF